MIADYDIQAMSRTEGQDLNSGVINQKRLSQGLVQGLDSAYSNAITRNTGQIVTRQEELEKMDRIRLEQEGVVISDDTKHLWKENQKIQRKNEKELMRI